LKKLLESECMERGYLDPNGGTYIATRSGALAKVSNQRIEWKKSSYVLDAKHHRMTEIRFPDRGLYASVAGPWRGFLGQSEFESTKGRLFETKELLIFIGVIQKYGIYDTTGRSGLGDIGRAQQAYNLRKKKYNSYFMLSKSAIKGFVKKKGAIKIYAISSNTKVIVNFGSKSSIDMDKFPFLSNYLEIDSVKELDQRHKAAGTEKYKIKLKMKLATVFAILFGFFGFGFVSNPERTTFFTIGIASISLSVIMIILIIKYYIKIRAK